MKISLITVCYNNFQDIERTLKSVIGQKNLEHIEYIVIDGGSTDGTLEILEQYRGYISVMQSGSDINMYDAINKGISLASTPLIGLIHGGDILHDEAVVGDIINYFDRDSLDILYGHSKIVNSRGIVRRINKSPNFHKGLLLRGWMPSHQSIYVRTEVFDKAGVYRVDIGGIADYEWFVRVFSMPFKIIGIDRFILKFALGGTSTTNYAAKFSSSHKASVIKCWTLNDLKPPLLLTYKMWARKLIQFIRAIRY